MDLAVPSNPTPRRNPASVRRPIVAANRRRSPDRESGWPHRKVKSSPAAADPAFLLGLFRGPARHRTSENVPVAHERSARSRAASTAWSEPTASDGRPVLGIRPTQTRGRAASV